MDIKELQKRSLAAAIKRGKVDESTTTSDIVCALTVEVAEFANAKKLGSVNDFREHLIDNHINLAGVKDYSKRCKEAYPKSYKGMMSGTIADELADIILICLTTAEMHDIDMDRVLLLKQRYNELR